MATTEKLKNKLMAKLTELFQLDQPDLDFGFYRIMHAKSEQVKSFIEKDLLIIIEEAFGQIHEDKKAELEANYEEASRVAREEYGVAEPAKTLKVQEAQAELDALKDGATAESDVYNHLYRFFERYYDEGDFISCRYYARENAGKAAPFAIPYNGEEVKLHWANSDQYYIKTAEYFSHYSFDITQAAEIRKMSIEEQVFNRMPEKSLKIHFRVVDASEDEHGNVKAAEDKKRFFVLHDHNPVEINEDNELVVNFEYKSLPSGKNDVDADTEKILKEKFGRSLSKGAMPNLAMAERVISLLQTADGKKILASVGEECLAALNLAAPTENIPNRPLLAKYINQYTARNTCDYFIHKDLSGFLKRELDFYIKNEIMHLDDIENADAPAVESYLRKLRVIRKIATSLIDFLAQLEDFQKKLWLKKKFVTETNYCITLDRVPEELYGEVAGNDVQREEWVRLFAIDEIEKDAGELPGMGSPAYSVPLTCEFLKANNKLVLDTAFFGEDFKARLLESIEDFDEQCDGLLIHSENFQALNLLQERYREQVKCVYIDPPYNTGNDGFVYKDSYQHSSWMSMIFDRVSQSKKFVTKDAAIFTSIDEVEQPNLRQLFDSTWGTENFVADIVWAAGRKNDSRLVSVSHEYMLVYANSRQFLSERKIEWRQRKKGLDEICAQHKKLLKEYGVDYVAMTAALKDWYKELADGHPSKSHKHYSCIDKRGVYFPDNISWPGGGGPKYQVLHPATGKSVKVPSRGWITSDEKKMKKWISDDLVHFGENENSVPCIKSYLKDREYQAPYSVFYQDGRAATKRLRHVLGQDDFGYPKDETVIAQSIGMLADKSGLILDYFAGSGTTGHAVINLNREDNGKRKYILVEMGSYFDTVLKPRIQKVVYSSDWKNGKPVPAKNSLRESAPLADKFNGVSHCFKYIRLESYEDTLDNLRYSEEAKEDWIRDFAGVRREEFKRNKPLRKDYMLHYLLEVETRGSQSLLNIDDFVNPWAYTLRIKRPGSDEHVTRHVDLTETFNYLIGLRVTHIAAPQYFDAAFTRKPDPELPEGHHHQTKLALDGKLHRIASPTPEEAPGLWKFQHLEGWLPADRQNPNNGQGERVLIIWRTLPAYGELRREDDFVAEQGLEGDNLMLDEWFRKNRISPRDFEYDTIYVNGSNNLPNLRKDDENWKVRLIEEEFHKKMWEVE